MKSKNSSLVLVLFLLGIFMGAIDSGIVTPAREIIQKSFGVAMNVGIWMVTIYTLAYAISMPIMGKLADRHGHKRIYTLGIALFGLGSLLCGLSNFYGTFGLFLASRVIQAIGAGGIIPIANSVIGLSFPEEKRGTALGLVGAIYGVATILGPTLGSGILGIAGNNSWGWLFFINVPISLLILGLSTKIEIGEKSSRQPLDIIGAILTAAVVGSIMYALTNLNFFHFADSIKSLKVYPFLLTFVILIPVLIFVETRAQDPVFNLKYFKDKQILTIFILAFLIGVGMMGMVFVPQFAENTLKIKAGSGGYLVTLLAIFSGIAAPLSGKILDKRSSRLVLALGFGFNICGTLILGFVAAKTLSFPAVLVGLAFMGFGVGFTMGAPLNYLILQTVSREESASALATMSLMRSVGVAISPNIMIGFIVNASEGLQTELMKILQKGFEPLMPKGMSMSSMMSSSGAGGGKTAQLFSSLRSEDVTTIVDKLKDIFAQLLPSPAVKMATDAIEKLRPNIENSFQSIINTGYTNMYTAAAIIAALGLIMTGFLKKKKAKEA